MTLMLELSPEIEAQIEDAARQSQTDVLAFIVGAATEKARTFKRTDNQTAAALLMAKLQETHRQLDAANFGGINGENAVRELRDGTGDA